MVLYDSEVISAIKTLERNNSFLHFTNEMIKETIDVYNSVKFEQIHSNKSLNDLNNFVSTLAMQIHNNMQGKTKLDVDIKTTLIRINSDAKHIYAFDEFFGSGEADNILEALRQNGIPTDVLIGFKFEVESGNRKNGETYEYRLGGKVRYQYDVDKQGSPNPQSMKIEIRNDKTGRYEEIYSWSAQNGGRITPKYEGFGNSIPKEMTDYENKYNRKKKYQIGKVKRVEKPITIITKSNKPKRIDAIVEEVYMIKTKKGKYRRIKKYRDKTTGTFISKSDYEAMF